ncbi:MAG: hypothetical protein IT254_05495 [Chitinophagaceae bacterium]|nr:hypothetical protein [Bacteroidota bacterium]MCC6257755.1 hypothetical protein [Chitinophagaceae bacterium]MCW5918141.1 hypothetical protein [Ferruginibacter sp.]
MNNSFVKFLIILFLSAALAFGMGMYFPWWSIAVAAFVTGLVVKAKPGTAFLGGLFGLFLLWAGLVYYISNNNDNILAHRFSLLMLKQDNPLKLILLTGGIGGVVGAFAALSGSLLRSIFSKP